MAEPENQTLRLLRDIRTSIEAMDKKFEKRFGTVDLRLDKIDARIGSLSQAQRAESIIGRYAVAEVDERFEAIEKRLKALEGRR